MKKGLCIFDFDGTLVNTITDVAICFNKTLEYYGFNSHPIELYKNFVGGDLETVVDKLLSYNQLKNATEEDVKNIKEYYSKLYLNCEKENTKPYYGIVELLKNLQNNDIKLAINTNKKQILTEELCQKFFSNIKFEKIIGYSENYPSKPNPQAVYDILEYYKEEKANAVYIGDGKTDVKTAESAGIDAIFVEWGQGKDEDKKNKSVKFIAKEPSDIYKFIMKE